MTVQNISELYIFSYLGVRISLNQLLIEMPREVLLLILSYLNSRHIRRREVYSDVEVQPPLLLYLLPVRSTLKV